MPRYRATPRVRSRLHERHGDVGVDGREIRFAALPPRNDGPSDVGERAVFVAPHDPAKERRRTPERRGA